MKSYQCIMCFFIYYEAKGWPADGILTGTKWGDIPDNWECPKCNTMKKDFDKVET